MSALTLAADQLVEELKESPRPAGPQKMRYTHDAMIDLVIQNPWISQNEIAAQFGYTPGWVSTVFASDAFQAKLAARRDEIVDPAIKATVEERFKALVILSLDVLHKKLSAPIVSDNVALRAAELGAKALGIGGHQPPPAPPSSDRLERLAERLIGLQSTVRQGVTYEAQVVRIPDEGARLRAEASLDQRFPAEAADAGSASAPASPHGD